MEFITLRDATPLITLRLVVAAGAALDPPGRPGTAWMTTLMLSMGGTGQRSYSDILDAFFLMGVHLWSGMDKEMTAFTLQTHADNLDASYNLLREMLTEPGWRPEDFERLREDAINHLTVYLRGQNDEELAKEALGLEIFASHPYGYANPGSVRSLRALTMDDVRAFYEREYTQARLTVGLGGGYPDTLEDRVRADFANWPAGSPESLPIPPAGDTEESTALLIEKPARSVAISFGFPIEVRRGHPDYVALLTAVSSLGQHRQSFGRLFQAMRHTRGLNYGDYAYIEYFPSGMFTLEPEPNLARQRQIFEIWIRPVERKHAHFALRLAIHELEKLITEGLPAWEFERTRSFLAKYVTLLPRTTADHLGYCIDSGYYGIGSYAGEVRAGLAALTPSLVNQAVRRHLHADRLKIVMAGPQMASMRDELIAGGPSPITYETAKPVELLDEDARVARRELGLRPDRVRVMDVAAVFE